MKQKLKTNNGDPISSACFGTMQFGAKSDENDARVIFDACRAAGVNFFDTAFGYTEGRSETMLGALSADDRDALFIATKCAAEGGAGRANILAQFDESRRRLNMDQVDILYIHMWDGDTALEETFETLAELVAAGKTRHIAVSNFSAWQIMKAQRVAQSFGIDIAMLQPMYNLVKRQVEVEILPMSLSEGFAVCPYSPLGGGLLTGKYAAGQSGRLVTNQMYAARYGESWMYDTAAKLSDIAKEVGVDPATLAVAWVARNPAITAPIISGTSLAQLQPSLDGIAYDLDAALFAKISALSPAPARATDRSEEAQ